MSSNKRSRDWEDCDDVDELKEMLFARDQQLEKLQQQVNKLKKDNVTAIAAVADAGDAGPPSAAMIEKLQRNIQQQITSQMVYKPSVKHGSSRVCAEVPNLSLPQVQAMLGDALTKRASNGPKQLSVLVIEDELDEMFPGGLSKSLRYGARLSLTKGLKFTYDKAERNLKITGNYSMLK